VKADLRKTFIGLLSTQQYQFISSDRSAVDTMRIEGRTFVISGG